MADVISQIVFTGICLFLRPEAGKPPEAAVFMEGRKDREGVDLPHHHQHQVYLAVEDAEYLVNQTPQSPSDELKPEMRVGGGGKEYQVFALDDRRITIESHVTEKDLDDQLNESKVPHLPEAWPLMMIGGGHTENKGLHEKKRPPALRYRVNSRVELAPGTLRVRHTNYDQWRFAPRVMGNAALTGDIPQEVVLEQTLEGNAVEIAIYNVESDDFITRFKITPRKPTTRAVTLLLANAPADQLFPTDECTDVVCTVDSIDPCCRDHHFALYYNAFDRPPRTPPIPNKVAKAKYPLPMDGTTDLFRVGGANCGPAQQP